MNEAFLEPKDILNVRTLRLALAELGDYVYGYYDPERASPFYIGKGRKGRALSHWTAVRDGLQDGDKYTRQQYARIAETMKEGRPPILKFLSYKLEETKRADVYGVVERTLQDAFGIQSTWEKRSGSDRIVTRESILIQIRNESKNYPVLSLESAYCNVSQRLRGGLNPQEMASHDPVLLVGLSKTYDPSYSQQDLAEMARMWWKLTGPKFDRLQKSESAILAAWSSRFGKPQIVGAWRIAQRSFEPSPEREDRFGCRVMVDYPLQRRWLGECFAQDGRSYEGPRIYLPPD